MPYTYVPNAQAQSWLNSQGKAGQKWSGLRKSNTTALYNPNTQAWLRQRQRQQVAQAAQVVPGDASYYYRYGSGSKRIEDKKFTKAQEQKPAWDPMHYAPNVPNAQAQAWLRQYYPEAQGAQLKSMQKPMLKSMLKPFNINVMNYPTLKTLDDWGPPVPPGYYDQPQLPPPYTGGGGYDPYPRYGGGGGGGGASYKQVTPMQGTNRGGYVGQASQQPQAYRNYTQAQRSNWLHTLTRFRIGG